MIYKRLAIATLFFSFAAIAAGCVKEATLPQLVHPGPPVSRPSTRRFITLQQQQEIVQRAMQLNQIGKPAEAEVILESLVLENPYNLDARNILGYAYIAQGKNGQALNEFKIISYVDPTASYALVGAAIAYMALKDYGRAQEELDRALKIRPDFWVYRALGDLYVAEKKNKLAATAYQHALQYQADKRFTRELRQKLWRLKNSN